MNLPFRYMPLLIIGLLTAGCASKNLPPGSLPEVVQKTGVIIAKEKIQLDDIEEKDIGVRTSIYASIFSGGRISLGLGFLFSPSGSEDKSETPIRYEIRMLDGSEIVLYSDIANFEVEDCVEVTINEDVEKYPPIMRRNRSGC
ncbi:MAG: hypothetical protein ACC663_10575 [Gammaproteobacteria bacterium]